MLFKLLFQDKTRRNPHQSLVVENEHQNSNPNLTIWREELIKKTNFEEKIKKEVHSLYYEYKIFSMISLIINEVFNNNNNKADDLN